MVLFYEGNVMKCLKLGGLFAVFLAIPSIFSMDLRPAEDRGIERVQEGIEKNNCELVVQGIEQGAPIDMKMDKNGNTVLHYLLYRGKNWKNYYPESIESVISNLFFSIKLMLMLKIMMELRHCIWLHCWVM